MMTLDQLVARTELASFEPVLPNEEEDRRLNACRKANLDNQFHALSFELRRQRAIESGFQILTEKDAVFALTGEEYTTRRIEEWVVPVEYEYGFLAREAYNDRTGNLRARHIAPIHYTREEGWKHFFKPKWHVTAAPLGEVKRRLPYKVLFRVEKAKNVILFNRFRAFAYKESWKEPNSATPLIVVAEVFNTSKKMDEHVSAFFFIANC